VDKLNIILLASSGDFTRCFSVENERLIRILFTRVHVRHRGAVNDDIGVMFREQFVERRERFEREL